MKKYILTENELRNLLESAAFCDALDWAGVDNWSGYEHAQELYEEPDISLYEEHI